VAIDINDVTFIDEKDLAPLLDLEMQIDELKIEAVQKQAELRKGLVKLRKKLGIRQSDKIDLSQGIAVPLEKTIEQAPVPEANGVV
tara:strand:+ start:295 stop:552 length:258 start_codon:yes stop_codon:yes gene_type:complete